MHIEKLSPSNAELYISYLKAAMSAEPEMMTAETVDEPAIRKRITDPFYMTTTSLLAVTDDSPKKAVGRIEYHFYGCMQDGARMTYVDWVYTLPEYRHRGVAQALFRAMESDCIAHGMNQYYLIRATNPDADKFYRSFRDAALTDSPILRKEL